MQPSIGEPFHDIREPYQLPANGVQALVRERIKDWGAGLCKSLGKKLVELTGVHFDSGFFT